jgi:hypothetical protein
MPKKRPGPNELNTCSVITKRERGGAFVNAMKGITGTSGIGTASRLIQAEVAEVGIHQSIGSRLSVMRSRIT